MSKIRKYPDNHSFQISDFRFQMSDFFNHKRIKRSYKVFFYVLYGFNSFQSFTNVSVFPKKYFFEVIVK